MAAIETLALALGKAVAGEIGKQAGRPIIERGKAALGLDPTRRALRRALQRALERFDAEHRSWVSSFFDEHFLKTRVAPLLARMIASGDAPTPRELAVAWRAQFGAGQAGIDDVEPAAAAFLRIVRKELRAEEHLRKMLDSHGIDTISEAVVTIAERQPASPPTPITSLLSSREERRVWRVKAASPRFTDRDIEMQRIHADLADGAIVAIHGLGGVGKSQLAAEYARRHPDEYDVAWWVRADNEKALMEDFAELAYTLGVAAASDSTQRAAAAAREWLERNDRWLLLLDDAAKPEDLPELAPAGHVVVTSRRHADWLAIGARAVELGVWKRADSVRFLAERTGDDAAAAAVAQALGDLPLALEQAAAYANNQRISLATYLDRLGDRDRDLLSVGAPRDYGRSVATTWSLALDEVSADPVASFLLAVCAFLAPEQIPRALFYAHIKDASAGGTAVEKLDQAIERLLGYSLLSADDESLSIHQLVQQLTRERIGPAGAQDALLLMFAAFPRNEQDLNLWHASARLLPHALAALEHAQAAQVRPDETIGLLMATGSYLRVRGDLRGAQNLLERALDQAVSSFGIEDIRVASSLNDLGIVCRDRGDLPRARDLLQRALDLSLGTGENDLRIAGTMTNLATVLDQQHKLDEALPLYESALATFERADKPLLVATALVNIAIIFDQQARHADARERYERALKIELEMPGGGDHPRVGDTRVNLSITLLALKELDAARVQAEKAVSIFESAHRGDHPQLARALDQVGTVLRRQNDLEGARRAYEAALEMSRRIYPPMHPDIGRVVANLGILARLRGDFAGARERNLEALTIQERTLGPEHPDVGRTFAALGIAMKAEGDAEGARRNFARALQIQLKARGRDHPEVADLLQTLGLDRFELTSPEQEAELQHALEEFLSGL